MMSWPDSSSPIVLLSEEQGISFEDASPALAAPPKWVCRAAPGSDAGPGTGSTCAGAMTHDPNEPFCTATNTVATFGEKQVAGDMQPEGQPNVQPAYSNSVGYKFDNLHAAVTGHSCIKLTGGASGGHTASIETWETNQAMSTNVYASTTDLLMQNLCIVVGNPSTRCYANAPWRAFCWMCAYLAEFNREPWGTLKEAVQTSLELSEPVGIKKLPGLQDLWHKHDLNTEGDAAHFVNSLWIHSSTHKHGSCSTDSQKSKMGATSLNTSSCLSSSTTLMSTSMR